MNSSAVRLRVDSGGEGEGELEILYEVVAVEGLGLYDLDSLKVLLNPGRSDTALYSCPIHSAAYMVARQANLDYLLGHGPQTVFMGGPMGFHLDAPQDGFGQTERVDDPTIVV